MWGSGTGEPGPWRGTEGGDFDVSMLTGGARVGASPFGFDAAAVGGGGGGAGSRQLAMLQVSRCPWRPHRRADAACPIATG